MLSILVAAASNNSIGKNNQLLWHLPNDLKFFKNTTWGGVVIMGRKTFESVNKPLPGRLNIVITRQKNWQAENVTTAGSLDEAVEKAKKLHYKEIFIIGGGEIYKEALPKTDKIYLTRVNAEIEGDTFFPAINNKEWKLTSQNDFKIDEKHAYDYSFEVWERVEK